ncbi:tetratricopeptide repeat protein 38 isoform X2 [Phoenix dactylifera]|uniref:Tetratricopeptide repeat protein 38 n=1 Tax=Phoenix dactylifera TaxID=42345 RepID=A0A8B8JCI4_PHODC|nr:tetratricopeptide repeat protein 38 isoform X2 [Phoenix dactylifera]
MDGDAAARTTTPTRSDRWGHPVRTTSDACIAAVDSYYEQFLSYGRNRAVILQAPLHDPSCVLANSHAAHFLAPKNPSKASSLLAAAASSLENATSYEKAVFRAISCLVGEEKDEGTAVERHMELLMEFPKDLVSLKRAQILCFYMGRADLSLNLVEQVLPQNEDQSYIYGMLAFPLLELGRMSEAEKAARKGIDINKHDLWSQHNLCHVFQYECRFKEAVDFMEACSSLWSSYSSFMYTHNWWHVAVCYLEGDSPLPKVLEVYDHYIWKELEQSDAEPGEVYVNALGLLMRVYVRDHMGYIEERLLTLADRLEDKSIWHMEWLLDLLALWALASTNKIHKAEDLLKSMKSRIYSMGRKKQHIMQRGIPLAEAIYEYGRGNYQKVFDILGPKFNAIDFKIIGASDEQLDVFNEVWIIVLLKVGQASKAIEEIEKQVSIRDGAPFLWRLLELCGGLLYAIYSS